jgi:molecular chaperone DnaJ
MAEKDLYEILGVSKEASDNEIKKAYRKLAMQHHPDKNRGDESAEKKFKEISASYEILKDPQKRAAYDQYGHDAFKHGNMGGGFRGFEDFASSFNFADFNSIFEDFFGEGFGSSSRHQQRRQRGSDLRYNMSISLYEAFTGKKTQIKIPSSINCDSCNGTGGAGGTSASTCQTCNGYGKVRSSSGFFTIEKTCSMCGGVGETMTNPCLKCSATGQINKQKTISISIPSGVDTGTRIRITGEGERGQRGGGSGDLYIFLNVKKDKLFERDEENIFCYVPIPITTAILGGEVEVPTIEGKKARLTIPPGTQSETQFRLKGKGMTVLRGNRRGDMYSKVGVEIPVNLTNKQKSILKEFENEGGTSKTHSPKSQSFFRKLKEAWEELT